jgi:DNA (cytosine-5)-methyltransferase 1
MNHPNRNKHRTNPGANPTPEMVRDIRARLGLTQKEAARVIFCSEQSCKQWESGERRMHAAFWELFRLKRPRSASNKG